MKEMGLRVQSPKASSGWEMTWMDSPGFKMFCETGQTMWRRH